MPTSEMVPFRNAIEDYCQRPVLDLSLSNTDAEHALTRYLLYYLLPLWTGAGVVDCWWAGVLPYLRVGGPTLRELKLI